MQLAVRVMLSLSCIVLSDCPSPFLPPRPYLGFPNFLRYPHAAQT